MKRNQLYLMLLSGMILLPLEAVGDQVYKWTDSQGQTHYSDTPPPDGTAAEKLQVFEAPEQAVQPQTGNAELERIKALSQALEASRKEREQKEQERRLEAQRDYYERLLAEQAAEQRRQPQESYYYPYYYPYSSYPPFKPWRRWQHDHPHRHPGHLQYPAQPPGGPQTTQSSPSPSPPLPQPDISSSLPRRVEGRISPALRPSIPQPSIPRSDTSHPSSKGGGGGISPALRPSNP